MDNVIETVWRELVPEERKAHLPGRDIPRLVNPNEFPLLDRKAVAIMNCPGEENG